MSERLEEAYASTTSFPTFVADFIERVIELLESQVKATSASAPGPVSQLLESSSNSFLLNVVQAMCDQLAVVNVCLYNSVVARIATFAHKSLLPGAAKTIGLLCSSVTRGRPDMALPVLLPPLLSRIEALAAHHPKASEATADEGETDAELEYLLHIASHVVFQCGSHILPFQSHINRVIEATQQLASIGAVKLVAKLLRNCLLAYTETYVFNIAPFEKDPKGAISHREMFDRRGQYLRTSTPSSIPIVWHQPSEAELQAAHELLELSYVPAVARLSQFGPGL